MKSFYTIILSSIILIACNQNTSEHINDKTKINSHYKVKYEFRSALINGKEYKPSNWIKKTLLTNDEKITPIKISNSMTIGVDIVVYDLAWRKVIKGKVYDIYYYTKDEKNNWKPISEYISTSSIIFDTKLINKIGFVNEENIEYFKVHHSVTFIPRPTVN